MYGAICNSAKIIPALKVRDILRIKRRDRTQAKLENLIRPRGRLACGISATSLFQRSAETPTGVWHERLTHRLQGVHLSTFAIRHSIQVEWRCIYRGVSNAGFLENDK
jgi:hypothetical protein